MAKSKLSSAYKAAASSGGSYQASLYDVANIGYQRESSAQLSEIKAQDMSRTVGMISEGLDLAGNVIRKGQRKKEMKTAAAGIGAKAKDMSLWGRLTGEEQMYEKVGESGEMGTISGSDVMAHYKLQQQEKAFGESVTVDETTGKATSTPAPGGPPTIPDVQDTEPTLAQEANIGNTYKEPIGPTPGGAPLGQAESPAYQGPTQSGKTLDVPQTSQGEIDKFNKSKAGTKLQKELSQLFDDDFSNYGFGN
jgi:hypothetical protein|tara:strand:+ start:33 stop:782 length:750 start_codon:yes stop_codon:yes gene_type:complete